MSNTVIQLKEISKSYGHLVLKQITLNLEQGKFYALLGKNGAGKSTLMRILMRYEQPDQGQGSILNQALDSDSDTLNLEVGYVSELLDYSLHLQIGKLFGNFARLYPKWDPALFNEFLAKLRIHPTKYFQELSRGQKMQVAFSAVAATHPKVILLDEITSVLDASARSFFMSYLGKFTQEGGTVLMATNIVSEVQHYATDIILIDDCKIKLDIPLSEISKKFSKLRRKHGQEPELFHELFHTLFNDASCIEVGTNSDNSTSYLVSAERLSQFHTEFQAKLRAQKQDQSPTHIRVIDEMRDNRGITAEEIFIYYTRNQAA